MSRRDPESDAHSERAQSHDSTHEQTLDREQPVELAATLDVNAAGAGTEPADSLARAATSVRTGENESSLAGDERLDGQTVDVAQVGEVTRETQAAPEIGPADVGSDTRDDTTDVKVRIPLAPRSGDTRDEAPAVRRKLPLTMTDQHDSEEHTDVVHAAVPAKWRAAMIDDEEFTDVSSKPGEELLDITNPNSSGRVSTSQQTDRVPGGLSGTGLSTDPIVVPSFSDVDPHQLAFAETAALGADGEIAKSQRRGATVQPGEVLSGRYRIGALIGRGGMATVYSAEHVTIGKKVAIKVLDGHLAESKVYVDRFLQEARAASMISHQNIVDINDFGYTRNDNRPFFVMEFLDGEDLRQTLEREGRLPWPRARHIALQICSALEAAHKKGVVHRDIKPENCFVLQRDEQEDFVKLLDFGIAKVTKSEPGELTSHGVVLGTLEYMSPERALNKPVDARADIYSLGVLLYRMMTGRTPFKDRSSLDIVTAHINETPIPPRRIAPLADISIALEALIMRALAKAPADRFQSAALFADKLRELPGTRVSADQLKHLIPDTQRQPAAKASGALSQSAGEDFSEAGSEAEAEDPADSLAARIPFSDPNLPLPEEMPEAYGDDSDGGGDDGELDYIGDGDLDEDAPTQTLSAEHAMAIARASRASAQRAAISRDLDEPVEPPTARQSQYAHRSDTVQSDAEPAIVKVTHSVSSESLPSGVVASGTVSSASLRAPASGKNLARQASESSDRPTIDIAPSDIFTSAVDEAAERDSLLDDMVTAPQKSARTPASFGAPSVELSSSAERDLGPRAPIDSAKLAELAETDIDLGGFGPVADDGHRLAGFGDTDVEPSGTGISERPRHESRFQPRTNNWVVVGVAAALIIAGAIVWKFVLNKPLPLLGQRAPSAVEGAVVPTVCEFAPGLERYEPSLSHSHRLFPGDAGERV